jgi:hypothetical protein
MEPWSTEYARSLSWEQWPDEIDVRFVPDIANRINALPLREPIKSTLATFGIEGLSWRVLTDWDIYTVSIHGEITSLTFSAWFFATAPPWSGGYGLERPEPVLVDEDGAETLLFAFDGVLHIDNSGTIAKCDVITVYTDPDLMPVLHDRGTESLFSFHSF